MSKLNAANRSNSKWIVEHAHKYFPKDYHKLKIIVEVETMIEAKEIAKKQFKDRKFYQYAGTTRSDINDFFSEKDEEIKQCLRCGNEVLKQRPICKECGYRFHLNCEGCGRDVIGRVWCSECGDHGIYHFQRVESLASIQSLRPEEEKVEKFVNKMLVARKDEDFGC